VHTRPPQMSGLTFEQLRFPVAIVLVLAAAVIFWPRGGDGQPAADIERPSPSVVVGEPGGEVLQTSAPAVTPVPTPTPAATPTPTPAATPATAEQPGFSAEVLACQSISGDACNGQLGTLPPGAGSFTALVRFTDASAGDTFNAVLSGPPGTIPGGPYTLQGGGDGYYYSTFTAGNLPAGDYTLTAVRNGEEVATTTFTRGG
jgi:hypothetical protein